MKIEDVKLSLLHPNTGQVEGLPKNPRFIRDEKFEALKRSIEDAPEMLELREIVAYDNGGEYVIIMGNMRYRAMMELGIKSARVKVLPAETPAEKLREYTIKDNVAFGSNDWDIIANEWDTAELEQWGMDVWDDVETEAESEGKETEEKESEEKETEGKETGEFCIMGMSAIGRTEDAHLVFPLDIETSEHLIARLHDGGKKEIEQRILQILRE